MCKVIFIGFLVVISGLLYGDYQRDKRNEGEAKARFISYYHGLDVTPEDAKWLHVSVTTTDIVIAPAEINVWDGSNWLPKTSINGTPIE